MSEKYYITTPIYYPSGNWHLGHCYTTVVCDAFARFHRMLGKDVFFMTGTDEHGQKIEKRALESGKNAKEFVDPLVDGLKDIWKILDVNYDKFIRTTDDYHIKAVQKIFKDLYDKGEIYKSEYSGHYCTPCEAFWTEAQLKEGKCPDCGRDVSLEKEESYFFRISKYADRILKLYEENESFLQPKSRVNEMVNNFLKPGLQDLCVSRTSFKWGIPVSFDQGHIVYVWIDALSNYITGLGYNSADTTLFDKYWPADLHMMAKEIIRFHSIIWPAILMALDLPLPKQVYGHGWLLIGGDKLSKSKTGNIKTELVDPIKLVERYGSDAVRYFLLREIPFGNDGVYTNESLLSRINSDLANDLGNLVSRTCAMMTQYFNGVLEEATTQTELDLELIKVAEGVYEKVLIEMTNLNAPNSLIEIFKLVQRANKYIDETMPWALNKEGNIERLKTVMYNLVESIRIISVMLMPYLTKTPKKILECLSINIEDIKNFESVKKFGQLKKGAIIKKSEPLFPRIDIKKELEEVDKLVRELYKKKEDKKEEKKLKETVTKPEINIADFAKLQLKVGLVEKCEKVEKSDKLLNLTVKIGEERRTIVSGIAKNYTAEEMVSKKVIVITNLAPVKLRGILSEGMILCAENGENLALLAPEKEIEDGSEVF